MMQSTQVTDAQVQPFHIEVAKGVLDDLRERLLRTRWPRDFGNDDWRYGANGAYLKELVDYWLNVYDWRAQERAMNSFRQFRAEIDGVAIHFIHEKGKGERPIPLVLTHGWPWTFWHFQKLIGPLTDPAAHGGDPKDCFDVIVPSLPGYGFSSPLTRTGVDFRETARLWALLMRDVLQYPKFAASGGDWGAFVTSQLGHAYPELLHGVQLTLAIPIDYLPNGAPSVDLYTSDERDALEQSMRSERHVTVHKTVNGLEPQTIAYAMNDSPVALLAWILMRLRSWSDCDGDVEKKFSKDDILTTVMIYWVTETFGSAARYYYEAGQNPWTAVRPIYPVVSAPTCLTLFAKDMYVPPRAWAEKFYNVKSWKVNPTGGHFAPMEEPRAVLEDLRSFFRPMRS